LAALTIFNNREGVKKKGKRNRRIRRKREPKN